MIETRSDKMAKITTHYHENLQKEGLLPETNGLRQAAIAKALVIRKMGRSWYDQTNLTNRNQHDINR
jgi:hypothetical protein